MFIKNSNNFLFTTNNALKNLNFNCGNSNPHACATDFLFGCATITNTTGTSCTVLALNSINLSATNAGPDKVAVTWSDNASTSSSDLYVIQRTTGTNEWSDIGTVTAGSASSDYSFTDANAPAGTIDYRIECIYADGKTLYSDVTSVTVAAASTHISIYPNPATGGHFYITTPNTGEMTVNVFTSTGQLLLHTSLQGQTQYTVQLPAQVQSLSAVVVQTINQYGAGAFTLLVR
jgi:hypothetical protein